MPTEADLCELMDRLGRREDGFVALGTGYELYRAALQDGLVKEGDQGQSTVALWFGKLISDGRAGFRSRHLGAREVPPGVSWGLRELQDHSDFFLTSDGREDARETRRLADQAASTELLVEVLPAQQVQALPSDVRAAVGGHLHDLRASLHSGDHATSIGAAKEFVESAAKACLNRAGETFESSDTVRQLYRRAVELTRSQRGATSAGDAAAAMTATVVRLAELRNAQGSGHGRIEPTSAQRADARAAAHLSITAVAYLFEGT